MEYSVEDISPVKKKVVITTEAQEVEAAVMGAVALYRTSVQLDGFRKGKVPASLIEQRFRDKIYEEARQDLINVHINDVMQQLNVQPLGGLNVDGPAALERGKDYCYSIEFEVLPAFDLPAYEGLEIEQEKVIVDEKEVADVIDRLRRDRAKLVPVDGNEPARDGQIASIDFSAYENGQPMEGVSGQNFDLALGEHQALPEFEALVKTIPYGQEGEGEITFPEDFLAKEMAGKTVTMKVKVHSVKERQLPELNDEFAKAFGMDSVDKLKESLTSNYRKNREELNRGAAQKSLLDKLLKMVDFPLPESIVDVQIRSLMGNLAARLERQGKSLDSLGKSVDDLRKEMLPEAEDMARAQVFLLSVARKEGLEVGDKEVNTYLFQESLRSGEDFKSMRESYERSGLIFVLRDRLLADKAMDLIYAKANVTEVEPAAPAAEASEAE